MAESRWLRIQCVKHVFALTLTVLFEEMAIDLLQARSTPRSHTLWRYRASVQELSDEEFLQRGERLARDLAINLQSESAPVAGGSTPSNFQVMPQLGEHAAPKPHQHRYTFSQHTSE